MIKLQGVHKSFTNFDGSVSEVLHDINFSVDPGELVVLKGASGSGKSTILSLIASLNKPTSGEVIVDGKRVSKLVDRFASEFRSSSIGFVFQRYNLLPNLSVLDNVTLPLLPSDPSSDELKERAMSSLKMFDMQDKAMQDTKTLSGGEQQRVAIARALVKDPAIIIADEPTANLDEELSRSFIEILRILKLKQKTVVVATHDPLFFDLDLVDRIISVEKGKII
ncbi:MAG: ABC transporter ATP-binding protein [Sulfuricurvum sp.]